jgi:hypothetical protein
MFYLVARTGTFCCLHSLMPEYENLYIVFYIVTLNSEVMKLVVLQTYYTYFISKFETVGYHKTLFYQHINKL